MPDVRWDGVPVTSERTRTLLAALARRRAPMTDAQLVAQLWDDEPANARNALQVVVSRTRTFTSPAAIARTQDGYRLALPDDQVDVWALEDLSAAAASAWRQGDGPAVIELIAQKRELLEKFGPANTLAQFEGTANGERTCLTALRASGSQACRTLHRLLGLALAQSGQHEAVLTMFADLPDPDDAIMIALLRAEEAVHGPAKALERFEAHRQDRAVRLGTDPSAQVRAVHMALLAADRPVRTGLREDVTELIGRDRALAEVHRLLRTHRVVSILGPGGLGKTRLAQAVARAASAPVVHVIELVGITDPADVVGEVGSALGVRESVTGRHDLTPAQRADVRSRIARQLATTPALLVLDNCEQVVDAVADLVGFLVATVAHLAVLTTSRRPLGISAEQVYPLADLVESDAHRLFVQRARAVRPDLLEDREAVSRIIRQLDLLPLAIELAAARARVMSLAEIESRLADRFALLKGADRSTPTRHQTLLAVIEWSWGLLSADEQLALRWLSVFQDGFSMQSATDLLGRDALSLVEGLASQSLLRVSERHRPVGVRYRMLETVREFGRLQLAEIADADSAAAAYLRWAAEFSEAHYLRLHSQDQYAAMDVVRVEENNLAEALRAALIEADTNSAMRIFAGLAGFWTLCGNDPRILSVIWVLEDRLQHWSVPEEHVEVCWHALSTLVNVAAMGYRIQTPNALARIRELAAAVPSEQIRGYAAAFVPEDLEATRRNLRALAESAEPNTAVGALTWCARDAENSGDPRAAMAIAQRALNACDPSMGPWRAAMLQTFIASLHAQEGEFDAAAEYVEAALPVLGRLGAREECAQLQAMLAVRDLASHDLDAAAARLDALAGQESGGHTFGAELVALTGRAELALARGDVEAGLATHREVVEQMSRLAIPGLVDQTGLEPWTLFSISSAVVAHALHAATSTDRAAGSLLRDELAKRCGRLFAPSRDHIDYPVAASAMVALGLWGLLHGGLDAADAVALLVLGKGLAYNRYNLSMAWEPMVAKMRELAPDEFSAATSRWGELAFRGDVGRPPPNKVRTRPRSPRSPGPPRTPRC